MTGYGPSFRLLGLVEVRVGRDAVHLSPLERELVALLALSANSAVSMERIVDTLWRTDPPGSARNRVQALVSGLRRAIGDAATVATTPSGYRLDVDPGDLDLAVFEEQVAQARSLAVAGDPAAAVEEFRAALALWRGNPLDGVSGHDVDKTRLRELRLSVLEERIAAELTLGRHADLIGELTALAADHPSRESLAGKLMLALYRSGRQAEALEAYRRLRAHLRDELGIEPGREVARLHDQILRRDPALDLAPPPAPSRASSPAQLPRDLPDFVGRGAEFSQLLADLDGPGGGGRSVVISAIDGMAGVGKTALAIHAAHRLAEWYPDGQLFLDLHAHTAGRSPVPPAAALATLLTSLGMAPERIPPGLDERAALWRSELAPRRTLIVLDNAVDAAQVRPLLPGAPGCLVLVTARRRLTDLEGALPLSLDVLPAPDARALFTGIAGERAAAAPEAVADVVELCGCLPLAIRVAASRLRHRPLWTVEHLADRLRDERRRLAELSSHERSVAAAFTLSYQDLDPDRRRMFCVLGVHPGVDVDPYAAASLADSSAARAEELLESLLDAHLLEQRTLGRYTFHDLLRDHARERAEAEHTPAERHAALGRLLAFYLHAAGTAMDFLAPHEKDRRPHVPVPATPVRDCTGPDGAARWLGMERQNLLMAAAAARRGGWAGHVTQLSTVLWRFLDSSGLHADALALHADALAAAEVAGDRSGQADALHFLGVTYEQLSRFTESVDHQRRALAIYRELGERVSEGNALNKLGIAHDMLGRYADALDCYGQALAIRRATGDRVGEAGTLQNLSYACRMSGRHVDARRFLHDALALHRDAGNRAGEGVCVFQLGLIGEHLGEYADAIGHFQQALVISREIGDRSGEGNAHNGAGQIHRRMGRYDEAMEHFGRALEVRTDTGDVRGMAWTLVNLGYTCEALGRYDDALDHHRKAATLCAGIGQELLQAESWNGLGRVLRQLGRHDDALGHHRRARDAFRAAGNAPGEARSRNGIGEAARSSGDPDQALAAHTAALALARQTGDRYEQARAHAGLAEAHGDLGTRHVAAEHWAKAHVLYTELGVPDADADAIATRRATTDGCARPDGQAHLTA
jgi:tetratricopeptide (TPR) repeat protein